MGSSSFGLGTHLDDEFLVVQMRACPVQITASIDEGIERETGDAGRRPRQRDLWRDVGEQHSWFGYQVSIA